MNRRSFLTLTALTPFIATNLMAHHDVYLLKKELNTLFILKNRLARLSNFVGYAHFNLISFNDALFYARNYSKIGKFSQVELSLIEKLFYDNPLPYGFYGEKTSIHLNNIILKKDVKKIPYTGHYLFKGKPVNDYTRLKKDIGKNIILTSGVRNIMKQLSLYCNKVYSTNGNLTMASSHIAPPAYSYHTTSDFDVGRRGWGYKNFTSDFAKTKEFDKMKKLNYIGMRYTVNNKYGVRFEPWHVKII